MTDSIDSESPPFPRFLQTFGEVDRFEEKEGGAKIIVTYHSRQSAELVIVLDIPLDNIEMRFLAFKLMEKFLGCVHCRHYFIIWEYMLLTVNLRVANLRRYYLKYWKV